MAKKHTRRRRLRKSTKSTTASAAAKVKASVTEISRSPFVGVLTRAKTLALQKCAPPSPSAGSYIQLRSRRLEKKPPAARKLKRRPSPASSVRPRPRPKRAGRASSGSEMRAGMDFEASFGDNVIDFENNSKSGTRETTPCSLIRDPGTVSTPGSSTRPARSPVGNLENSTRLCIPTGNEMDKFFAGAEEVQQKQFIEKYNFDPVNEKPLPGRYEWIKVAP